MIDLTPFCGTASSSWMRVQDTPFVQGGYRCATDGRIAVRIPCEEPDTTAEIGRVPNMSHVFTKFAPELVTDPLVITETIRGDVDCKECDGTGFKRHSTCTECDGEGEVECDSCGHKDECETCDGYGVTGTGKCDGCGGKKHYEDDKEFIIQGAMFDVQYIRKIQSLPNVRILVTDPEQIAFFVFDGGHGGLMPLILK